MIEITTQEFVCNFCGLTGCDPKIIIKHEEKCHFNPEYIKFMRSETKKAKRKLITLIYNRLKDNKDFKLLMSIKDGDYTINIEFTIHHIIMTLIDTLSNENNINVFQNSSTADQIKKSVIKKLEKHN
jgi:hypothetical protein